jgi:dihydrofolate reductase
VNPPPVLTLIAAVSADGFISTGTGVPWHLPRDITHFREVTRGQWLLIGRRTYGEMLGWFHDHHPLILSRDAGYTPALGQAVPSVPAAIKVAQQAGAGEIFVCGGGGAYAAAMPQAERLIVTHVGTTLGGGVPFPAIAPEDWRITSTTAHPADTDHAFAMAITTYARRRGPS